jgi:Zn-dependent protease with chaperone function
MNPDRIWLVKVIGVLWVFIVGLSLPAAAWAQTGPATSPPAAQQAMQARQPGQAYHLPPEKLIQAEALDRIRSGLHFGSELWELALLLLALTSGFASRLDAWAQRQSRRRWLQCALFSATLAALLFLVAELPVDALAHAASLHYGISIEGWASWLIESAKSFALSLVLEVPLLMLAWALIRWSPTRYWLWFAAAMVPLMVLSAFLLPQVIEPIFYEFTPLAATHPALAAKLQRVVARTGTSIPPERMFLMKAGDKSNGLNAYVTGLGPSKRIVIWDTTADRMPEDEILFTFAHESGHYVLHHIAKGLVLGAAGLFLLFWLTARLAERLVRRFGNAWRVDQIASLSGIVVLLFAVSLLNALTEPIQSAASRYAEHEADIYGQEAIHGILPDPQRTAVAAFNSLGEAYLDSPNPNPFVVFWTYDHPSIQSRANFAASYNPWFPGGKPRFFPPASK